jgi:glutathione S-transferase
MNGLPITLRYFDARGRGQFIRAYLHARGIEFVDDRVPLEPDFATWVAVRDDRSLNGPLKRLPVLRAGERLIPEALVIADFLHHEFGDAAAMSAEENERHAIIVSSLYTDALITVATLIWADLLFKGVDLGALAHSSLSRLERVLAVLDQTLAEWHWVERMHERPITVADCLLFEQLDQAVTTFGLRLTFGDMPTLLKFRNEHPGRAAFEGLLAETPCQITGRPGEAAMIARIQALLAGASAASA